MSVDRLISARGAARILGVSVDEVHRLRLTGELSAAWVRLTSYMFDPDDVAAYAERAGRQRTYDFSTGETVTVIYDEE